MTRGTPDLVTPYEAESHEPAVEPYELELYLEYVHSVESVTALRASSGPLEFPLSSEGTYMVGTPPGGVASVGVPSIGVGATTRA